MELREAGRKANGQRTNRRIGKPPRPVSQAFSCLLVKIKQGNYTDFIYNLLIWRAYVKGSLQ